MGSLIHRSRGLLSGFTVVGEFSGDDTTTVTYPTGMQAGDLIILFLARYSYTGSSATTGASVSPPSGYTTVQTENGSATDNGAPAAAAMQCKMTYKIATGSEGATDTHSQSGDGGAYYHRGVVIRLPSAVASVAWTKDPTGDISTLNNYSIGSSAATAPSVVVASYGKGGSGSISGFTLDGVSILSNLFGYQTQFAATADLVVNATGDPAGRTLPNSNTCYGEFICGYFALTS